MEDDYINKHAPAVSDIDLRNQVQGHYSSFVKYVVSHTQSNVSTIMPFSFCSFSSSSVFLHHWTLLHIRRLYRDSFSFLISSSP